MLFLIVHVRRFPNTAIMRCKEPRLEVPWRWCSSGGATSEASCLIAVFDTQRHILLGLLMCLASSRTCSSADSSWTSRTSSIWLQFNISFWIRLFFNFSVLSLERDSFWISCCFFFLEKLSFKIYSPALVICLSLVFPIFFPLYLRALSGSGGI